MTEGLIDDCAIYYVLKGSVEMFYTRKIENQPEEVVQMTKFGVGQYIGANSFFTAQPRDISFRSVGFTSVLKINR